MKVAYVVWEEDDLWVSQSLVVDVASQGSTKEEAIANLKDALDLYFSDKSKSRGRTKTPIFGELELQNA